jgi:hypothetical protein
METYYGVIPNLTESECEDYPYVVMQYNRSAYYDDIINPKGCINNKTAYCPTIEIAKTLCGIFNLYPLTKEFLNVRPVPKPIRLKNSERSNIEYQIYVNSESLVRYETDLYNGTDQRVILYQLMKDSSGKYSARSKSKEICKFYNTDYIPVVLNLHYSKTKELFFNT